MRLASLLGRVATQGLQLLVHLPNLQVGINWKAGKSACLPAKSYIAYAIACKRKGLIALYCIAYMPLHANVKD